MVAVVAALIAAVTLIGNGGVGATSTRRSRPPRSRSQRKSASLETESGWSVARADDFTTTQGEMAIGNGHASWSFSGAPQISTEAICGTARRTAAATAIWSSWAARRRSSDTTTPRRARRTSRRSSPLKEDLVEIRGDALGSEDATCDCFTASSRRKSTRSSPRCRRASCSPTTGQGRSTRCSEGFPCRLASMSRRSSAGTSSPIATSSARRSRARSPARGSIAGRPRRGRAMGRS